MNVKLSDYARPAALLHGTLASELRADFAPAAPRNNFAEKPWHYLAPEVTSTCLSAPGEAQPVSKAVIKLALRYGGIHHSLEAARHGDGSSPPDLTPAVWAAPADVWSLGCLAARLASRPHKLYYRVMRCSTEIDRHDPTAINTQRGLELHERIASGAVGPATQLRVRASIGVIEPRLVDLIRACTALEPAERPKATQVAQQLARLRAASLEHSLVSSKLQKMLGLSDDALAA